MERILIIDPDENSREQAEFAATGLPLELVEFKRVPTAALAVAYLRCVDVDVVLCDRRVEGLDGFDIVHQIKDRLTDGAVILTGGGDPEALAEEARTRGAYDCLVRPIRASEFLLALTRVRDRVRRSRKLLNLNRQLEQTERERAIVAASEPMIQALESMEKAAEFNCPALLRGEPGTRKYLMAQAIHAQSARNAGPFIPLDCAQPREAALKHELFGSIPKPGRARTHAHRGLLAQAEGGTLFLRRVENLVPEVQTGLLRIIEENELWNESERKARQVDVRIVAGTSQDLAQWVADGRFDETLYERLTALSIDIPPLRHRKADIPLLIDQFLAHLQEVLGKNVGRVSTEALERLCDYPWPGNVRELRNAVEHAAILSGEEGITLAHLPSTLAHARGTQFAESGEDFALKPARQAFEAQIIQRALAATDGNRTRAASLLAISHRSLLYKLKAYGIRD